MLKIEIDTSNDAFQPDPAPEVTRLLLVATHRVFRNNTPNGNLVDANGTTVGTFSYGP